MWIVLAAAVGQQPVPEQPEGVLALSSSRLGGEMKRLGAGALARNRKMAHADPQRQLAGSRPGQRAAWAGEIQVDDDLLPAATDVIVWADRRDRGAGQLRQDAAIASKITFAPGTSSGVGDACEKATIPSSSTRTSERLAWPRSSIKAP